MCQGIRDVIDFYFETLQNKGFDMQAAFEIMQKEENIYFEPKILKRDNFEMLCNFYTHGRGFELLKDFQPNADERVNCRDSVKFWLY
jgi:hypothetical protein